VDDNSLIEFRRTLHQNAETAFLEFGTAARIEKALEGLPVTMQTGADAADLSPVVGLPDAQTVAKSIDAAIASGADPDRVRYFAEAGTAILATIVGDKPGPVWGIRTDIDALPVTESDEPDHVPAALGFNATNGAMHACGHDSHATMGVGLLHRLADRDFPGTVKIFFQPAEEGVRGAQPMIDAGAADDVDRMLAIHVAGDMAFGSVIGSFEGGMATRKFLVEFHGRASHAAGTPEAGRNALLAASMAASALMSIPRFSSADTRINVGTINAGTGVNIVPARATLTGEVRATDDEIVEELLARAIRIVEGSAHAYDVTHTFAVSGQSATLTPDDSVIDLLVASSEQDERITSIERSEMLAGSDDANLLIRHVQQRGGVGAYCMVGASSPGPHHSSTFDLDERSISVGIGILERVIRTAPTGKL